MYPLHEGQKVPIHQLLYVFRNKKTETHVPVASKLVTRTGLEPVTDMVIDL